MLHYSETLNTEDKLGHSSSEILFSQAALLPRKLLQLPTESLDTNAHSCRGRTKDFTFITIWELLSGRSSWQEVIAQQEAPPPSGEQDRCFCLPSVMLPPGSQESRPEPYVLCESQGQTKALHWGLCRGSLRWLCLFAYFSNCTSDTQTPDKIHRGNGGGGTWSPSGSLPLLLEVNIFFLFSVLWDLRTTFVWFTCFY